MPNVETPEEKAAREKKEADDKAAREAAAANNPANNGASSNNVNVTQSLLDEFADLKKFVGYPGKAAPLPGVTESAPTHDPAKCMFGPFCPYGHEAA